MPTDEGFRIGRSVPPTPGVYTVLFDHAALRIPIIADASMPANSLEVRSGGLRLRIRWPDEETELDRWADDGGAL